MHIPGTMQTVSKNTKLTILFVTTAANTLVPLMTSTVTVALPAIGVEFNLTSIALGWVGTVYILASAALMIPCGRIADIYSMNKTFIIGIFIFGLGSLLSALSHSGVVLIIARAVQGTGGAALQATSFAMLTEAYPIEERGKALGINAAVMWMGMTTGPFIGGILTERLGWRSIFYMSLALSIFVIIGALWKLGWKSEVKGGKFDLPGTFIYGMALIALMYGVSLLPDLNGIWLVLVFALGIAAFIWWENKTKTPLIQLGMFRHNRGFTFSNIASLINYSGIWGITFLISLYLQYIRGLSAEGAGLVLIASPAAQTLCSTFAGRLSDRIEPRILASIGMAISTISVIMFIFLTPTTSYIYIIAALIIFGAGFAIFVVPNMNAIMSSAGKGSYGFASAALATSRQIGMVLSMGIVMIIFATVIGRVAITPERYPAFMTSTRIAFVIFALLCVGAIFASLARGNIRKNRLSMPIKK